MTDSPATGDSTVAQRGDRELVGMARGGGLNLASALVSQAALLGITVVMVRFLGKRDVGLYAQAFAFLVLLGLLSLSGFRAGLTRFVAVHLADRDQPAVHGTTRLGVGISTAGAVVLGVILYVAAPALVSGVFNDDRLITPLRYVALALPAATFTDAALSATQGFRTMKAYALIGMVFEPLTRFLLTIVLIAAGLGLTGAMVALLVSNYAAAALAFGALRRMLGPKPGHLRFAVRELFGFSTVSWFASLASSGLVWADTILLGHFRPSAEIGVYNVSTRIVMLATFVATPISASFAPRIAHLYHRRNLASLERAYAAATSWVLRLSLPAFVVLVVFSSDLLGLFGPEYRVGAQVTIILAIGKIIDSATGPCGVMLNQSGRPGLSMIDNVGALILNIGLNLWLIPTHGILGSAVAWQVSLIVVNTARVLQVWLVMRMLPFDTTVIKGFVAAVAAFGAGAVVHALLSPPWGLPAGAVVIVSVYVAALLALGFSTEDRLVLDGLRRRLVPGRVARVA